MAALLPAEPAVADAILAAADPLSDARTLLLLGMVVGVLAFALVTAAGAFLAVRRAQASAARASAEAERLAREADAAQTLLVAEPQVLVHWDEDGEARILTASLPAEAGVPGDVADLLRFSGWIERESGRDLERRVEGLRAAGAPFNVLVRAQSGSHLEVDGRAAGGSAVLKIRDLGSRRKELAQLLQQHKSLGHYVALMRGLLDALPSPVWLRASGGRIDWVNRAYTRAVEASGVEEVRGQQIEFLEARDRAGAERSLADGEVFRRRVHVIVGGERRAFDAIALPVGQGSAGVAMDAAALESAEGELSRHIEAHGRILDRIATAVAVFSPDQRLAYHNQAYADLWQLDPAWLETRPREGEVLDRLRETRRLPEQADYRAWKARRLAAYTSLAPSEERWHLPDGRTVHVVADRAPDGGITYLYEDVTARLKLESRYNSLMHVQKETLDHVREAVAVFASDGRLKLFNPAFVSMWKLNRADLEQEPHIDEVVANCRVLLDNDEAWAEVKSAITGIDDQRQTIGGQLSRPDGSVLYYAGLPLPDGATLLTYLDITDSKRMERVLMERNEALEAADKLKNAFISHVSYELRAPLTSIIGFSELLAEPMIGPLNPRQSEYVQHIRTSSDALLAIINDILDLATIDAGAAELTLSPVQVRDVIASAVLGVRDRLQRAGLHLDVQIEDDVSEFVADARRVTQVLFNLLSNAIGFSEAGAAIRLHCRREGGMLAFIVRDQGIGMPREYQNRAFDRFESRPQGSRHRGAGLGLSLVKSLVELHGGEVSLVSVEGQGTRATVRFPLDRPGSAPPGEAPGRTRSRGYPPAAE